MYRVITSRQERKFSTAKEAEEYFYERANRNISPVLILDTYGRAILLSHSGGCFQTINP